MQPIPDSIPGRPIRRCLYLFIVCLLVLASPARGQGAAIKDMVVVNSSSRLLLYLTVVNAFTDDMEKGIQNGIPATFTFYVELYRERKGWLDNELASHTFTRTLTYDNLKEEFRVAFAERENRTVTVKTLAEAKALMTELNGYPVAPLGRLSPGSSYQLKVKASLAKKTLPLYFHYLIPFWRLWDFETDWHSLEFRY